MNMTSFKNPCPQQLSEFMRDGPRQREIRERTPISEFSIESKSFASVFFQLFLVSCDLGTKLSDSNAIGGQLSLGPPGFQSELLMVSKEGVGGGASEPLGSFICRKSWKARPFIATSSDFFLS